MNTELGLKAKHHYKVECIRPSWDADFDFGIPRISWKRVWVEEFDNRVVTEGLNAYLTNTLKTIPGSVAWYVGLKDTGTIVAGDLMSSHAGWAELVNYSDTYRPTFTPGTVANGSVDNSAAKAVFNINGADDVYGAFMCSEHTKSGTTGQLLGGHDFTAPRSVQANDILNVTVTCSIADSGA